MNILHPENLRFLFSNRKAVAQQELRQIKQFFFSRKIFGVLVGLPALIGSFWLFAPEAFGPGNQAYWLILTGMALVILYAKNLRRAAETVLQGEGPPEEEE